MSFLPQSSANFVLSVVQPGFCDGELDEHLVEEASMTHYAAQKRIVARDLLGQFLARAVC
jgi:hypothetical protein